MFPALEPARCLLHTMNCCPCREWAVTVPAYIIITIALGLGVYSGLDHMLVKPPGSYNSIAGKPSCHNLFSPTPLGRLVCCILIACSSCFLLHWVGSYGTTCMHGCERRSGLLAPSFSAGCRSFTVGSRPWPSTVHVDSWFKGASQ